MDILYFFNRRIDFIRQFYATTSTPYLERKQKIEAKEKTFLPSYCEDAEPAFLSEWLEADESVHVLGYSCISMLAAALHLYFKTWVAKSGIPVSEKLKSHFRETGWFNGYKIHFYNSLVIDFGACSSRLDLLKEVILARNRIEHPISITGIRTSYVENDLQKLTSPFFVNQSEAVLYADTENEDLSWLIPPTLWVTEKQLLDAIVEVENFTAWFEAEIMNRIDERSS